VYSQYEFILIMIDTSNNIKSMSYLLISAFIIMIKLIKVIFSYKKINNYIKYTNKLNLIISCKIKNKNIDKK
jgi:hypothetical protein